jgi:GT2 family glycosyltransferase
MTSPTPQVGISLLNWNGYADTAKCLASLRRSEFRPARILVFDNGSADGSAERLQAEFLEIDLVRSGENVGFSEGNNRAARMLLDAGMDYVWILNNDTEVPPDCLGWLVRALEEDPGLGAVSAKIWFMDGRKPLCYAGATCHPWTFEIQWRGLREPDTGQYDTPEDTEILTGCCLLVRADVLRRIGLFNRTFFAYGEDADWSLRARRAGIRKRYEPRATLWHKMFGSSARDGKPAIPKSSPRAEFLAMRNFILRVRLHTRPWSLRRWVAIGRFVFFRYLPRGMALLLLPSRRAAGWASIRGLWAGLWIPADPGECRL